MHVIQTIKNAPVLVGAFFVCAEHRVNIQLRLPICYFSHSVFYQLNTLSKRYLRK